MSAGMTLVAIVPAYALNVSGEARANSAMCGGQTSESGGCCRTSKWRLSASLRVKRFSQNGHGSGLTVR